MWATELQEWALDIGKATKLGLFVYARFSFFSIKLSTEVTGWKNVSKINYYCVVWDIKHYNSINRLLSANC